MRSLLGTSELTGEKERERGSFIEDELETEKYRPLALDTPG